MTAPRATDSRDLIEQVRKVNKLLSLYVLALQEDMALSADDHYRLASAARHHSRYRTEGQRCT